MAKRKTLLDEIHEELANDRELNELYQCELAKLDLAEQIASVRERAGLSQAALARRIGTQQAGVARMENQTYRSYTMTTLAKIAAATGARLEVRLVPKAARGHVARQARRRRG